MLQLLRRSTIASAAPMAEATPAITTYKGTGIRTDTTVACIAQNTAIVPAATVSAHTAANRDTLMTTTAAFAAMAAAAAPVSAISVDTDTTKIIAVAIIDGTVETAIPHHLEEAVAATTDIVCTMPMTATTVSVSTIIKIIRAVNIRVVAAAVMATSAGCHLQ